MKLPILKTILNAIGIKTAAFTAATTDLITSAAHGLKDHDLIVLTTTGTLPAGLTASVPYVVEQAATNTFKLKLKSDNTHPDITDTGTGTHTWTMHDIGWSINVKNYENKEITLDTDGGADAEMTVKFQGSHQRTEPDFSAAQTPSNQWEYIAITDLNSGTFYAGSTGFSIPQSGNTDEHKTFNIEDNSIKWINCIISGYVAGEVTVKIQASKSNY